MKRFVVVACREHSEFYIFDLNSAVSQLAYVCWLDKHKECKIFHLDYDEVELKPLIQRALGVLKA